MTCVWWPFELIHQIALCPREIQQYRHHTPYEAFPVSGYPSYGQKLPITDRYAAAITSLSERHHKSDELHIGPYTCSGQGIMRLPSGGLSCLLDRMKFIHHAFPFSKTPSGACGTGKRAYPARSQSSFLLRLLQKYLFGVREWPISSRHGQVCDMVRLKQGRVITGDARDAE